MQRPFLLFLILSLASCASAPTKVYESVPLTRGKPLAPKVPPKKELVISEQTVIIDSRPAFVYALSHLPKSINLSWQEFTETKPPRGRLVKDLFAKTRRLARIGISPSTPVVIIGEGKVGKSEEGRLAWTLRYLGVKDVDFASKDYFDQAKWVSTPANSEEAMPQSVAPWKPDLQKNLLVDKEEMKGLIVSKHKWEKMKRDENAAAKLTKPEVKIIDVRPAKEYLASDKVQFLSEILNIEWTEFFDDKERVNFEMLERLRQVKVTPQNRIVVLSQSGIESAAVTLALQNLGFVNAGNFAGGYEELAGMK